MYLKMFVIFMLLCGLSCDRVRGFVDQVRYPLETYAVPRCFWENDREQKTYDFSDAVSSHLTVQFVRTRGGDARLGETAAYLCWMPDHLRVQFVNEDRDIRSPYTKRDQPIYKSEVVEMFIDGDRDKNDYIELQASPAGVLFDSHFHGGARQHMNKGYDSTFEVETKLFGTLNNHKDLDKRWTSTWTVPVKDIKDISGVFTLGQKIDVHMYRINHNRRNGQKQVEALALSPPLKNDFHVLERMATLHLVESAAKP